MSCCQISSYSYTIHKHVNLFALVQFNAVFTVCILCWQQNLTINTKDNCTLM